MTIYRATVEDKQGHVQASTDYYDDPYSALIAIKDIWPTEQLLTNEYLYGMETSELYGGS
jgi:hypothetical protein